jgi:hypothetical protein
MNLFEKAIYFAKSIGHSVESEEHKLINEFITYLGSSKVVSGFSDSPVIAQFAAAIAPQVDPTPVLVAPPPVVPEAAPEVAPEATPEATPTPPAAS